MPLTAETFAALVLEDTDGRWELFEQRLREKPPMSFGHNEAARELAEQLYDQLDRNEYRVLQNSGHLAAPRGNTLIPDVAVRPRVLAHHFSASPRQFEVYEAALPFVAEVWSPSTGTYDVDTKIPVYRQRGDLEIWRLHPFEPSLRRWLRQADGDYVDERRVDGVVSLHALPGIVIDLDRLFGR